ncbi:flagellar basal body-associated FliL family protein [Nocardioidaceae bacterium]|nr:flagellar basal body-associated FliL family protein [Nocardioidaceae bacterium]
MSVTDMPEAEEARRGPSKIVLVGLAVVVLVLAAAAYFVVFAGDAEAEAAPEPGEVLTLDPIQINLSGSHYLRLGMALQLTADATHADGSKALDAAIDQFSGMPMEELTQAQGRRAEKRELLEHLEKVYHHEVMDVFFTEFVMQ